MHSQSLRRLFALVCVAAAFLGCSHKVESPRVSLQSIAPNLLCNAQRIDSQVVLTLSGNGFTPMPQGVLSGPPVLVLPSVELAKRADLSGGGASSAPVVFSGDPDKSLAGNLSWQSETKMRIRITDAAVPASTLSSGLYDVTVTNPDKDNHATITRGLAVVDPPRIDSVEPLPPALCTTQAIRKLVINGQNFLKVAGKVATITLTAPDATRDVVADSADSCSRIPGEFAGGVVELCNQLTVTLPPDLATNAAETFDIVVTSPEPASCQSSEPIKVVIVPPPLVTNVIPPGICVDQGDQVVTVQGGFFARINGSNVPTVAIKAADGTETTFAVTSVANCVAVDPAVSGVELCDTLTFNVMQNALPPGSYTLTVTNPDPVGCTSTDEIDFSINPPPRIDSLAPATVCSGGSIVVASGAGFQPGATAELQCANAATVQAAGTLASADGTSLTITFGPGIVAGETCDIVVQNPDGCEDRPLPHPSISGIEGPILFNVDPDVAYSGINTKVLLYLTALAPPFTVQMWPDNDAGAAVEIPSQLVAGQTTLVQATIPAGTAAGTYTLVVNDQSGCFATMTSAVTVTDDLTISTGTVTPSFGDTTESIAITISLGSAPPTASTPRAFLNPPGDTDSAIALQSVTVLDATTLTAVVPKDTPVNTYDVVIVWPDGSVAVLTDAYTSVSEAPPVVDDVVPQSIVNQAGQTIDVRGTGFDASTISLRCQTATGEVTLTASSGTVTCDATGCTESATVDASTLAQGTVCVVRVTNASGAYGEFSAVGVTNSSLNLSAPIAGPTLNVGRRALVSAAVKATAAARFVYAVGGDEGDIPSALDSVEFAPVDIFGNMSAWTISTEPLSAPRTFAASATVGRYIYVFGGNDGAGAIATAERALVLSPEEIPIMTGVDLCLAGGATPCFSTTGAGLEAGLYSYKVAATIDPNDPRNLGGETLASDPIIMKLKSVGTRDVTVKISWTAPTDSEGTVLSGITGYRIYRTPKDGVPGSDELLLATVDATTFTFIDDGSLTLGTEAPLPQGSTSVWQALPDLGVAREGAAGAVARDPNDPDTYYVYAFLGRDGATGYTSYEYLPVTVLANQRQDTAGTWTQGTEQSAVGRWQHGAWTVDSVVSRYVSGSDVWIYLGAGLLPNGTTNDASVEAGMVTAGGQLTAFADDPTAGDVVEDFSQVRVGYGTAAASNSLFVFGGRASQVMQNATAAKFVSPAPGLANNSWNNEGLTMTSPRYLMGSAIQSAFIFLVAGDTGTGVTNSTETVVW